MVLGDTVAGIHEHMCSKIQHYIIIVLSHSSAQEDTTLEISALSHCLLPLFSAFPKISYKHLYILYSFWNMFYQVGKLKSVRAWLLGFQVCVMYLINSNGFSAVLHEQCSAHSEFCYNPCTHTFLALHKVFPQIQIHQFSHSQMPCKSAFSFGFLLPTEAVERRLLCPEKVLGTCVLGSPCCNFGERSISLQLILFLYPN